MKELRERLSEYKNDLHLLNLDKGQESELIDIIECPYDVALKLNEGQIHKRRRYLMSLLESNPDLIKISYPLWYALGNMENNYKFVLCEKRKGEI